MTRSADATVPGGPVAMGWRMWIPCITMGDCFWLAFVDRQVLAVLSPTILADTDTVVDFEIDLRQKSEDLRAPRQ